MDNLYIFIYLVLSIFSIFFKPIFRFTVTFMLLDIIFLLTQLVK